MSYKCTVCQILDDAREALEYPNDASVLAEALRRIQRRGTMAILEHLLNPGDDEPGCCKKDKK